MSVTSIFRKKEDEAPVPEVEVRGDEVTIVSKDDDSRRTLKMPETKFG